MTDAPYTHSTRINIAPYVADQVAFAVDELAKGVESRIDAGGQLTAAEVVQLMRSYAGKMRQKAEEMRAAGPSDDGDVVV